MLIHFNELRSVLSLGDNPSVKKLKKFNPLFLCLLRHLWEDLAVPLILEWLKGK